MMVLAVQYSLVGGVSSQRAACSLNKSPAAPLWWMQHADSWQNPLLSPVRYWLLTTKARDCVLTGHWPRAYCI